MLGLDIASETFIVTNDLIILYKGLLYNIIVELHLRTKMLRGRVYILWNSLLPEFFLILCSFGQFCPHRHHFSNVPPLTFSYVCCFRKYLKFDWLNRWLYANSDVIIELVSRLFAMTKSKLLLCWPRLLTHTIAKSAIYIKHINYFVCRLYAGKERRYINLFER
jgi:hypothetical protein